MGKWACLRRRRRLNDVRSLQIIACAWSCRLHGGGDSGMLLEPGVLDVVADFDGDG